MKVHGILLVALVTALVFSAAALAQDIPLLNWTAPPYWRQPAAELAVLPGDSRAAAVVPSTEAAPLPQAVSAALPFFAVSPCRLADTRDATFPPGYGPPMLASAVTRDFAFSGRCSIPADALAVSSNLTVTNTQGPGFVVVFPTGGSPPSPLVSAINYGLRSRS